MAEFREGEWLSRSVESCPKEAEMGGKGWAVAGCLELLESTGNGGGRGGTVSGYRGPSGCGENGGRGRALHKLA